jgi:hypothetical protein
MGLVVGIGGLLPVSKSHPNNDNYNYGDGWDHPHKSVVVEASLRKKHAPFPVPLQHKETRSEPLAPGDPASHIGNAVREIQALAAEAAS